MFILEQIKAWLISLGNYGVHSVLPAILLLLVGLIVIRIVLTLVSKGLKKSKLEKAAHTLIKSVVRVALYLLLLLMVASSLGIDVTGVVALASVLTLAVSLALQNALSNVVGGFTLLSNKPFVSGDFVEIAGQSGTVQEIGLTYTKLNTADNKVVSIPNSSVVAAQIVNYTTAGTRRVEVQVCAAYTESIEDVLAALRQAGAVSMVLPDKEPVAMVSAYKDSAIEYGLHVWCKSADYWGAMAEVKKNIKTVFDEKGIAMTYPHINVHLDK